MNIKEIKSQKLYKEYSLVIPYDEVDTLINSKINEIIPTVTLPGFRKGKAPLNIVKKKYESNVISEVIEKLVQEKTKSLLEDKKIKPFRQPRIDLKKYVKLKPVEIEIKIDLEPDINLKDFKDLKFKKYEIKLDKKTVEENYKQFLLSQKSYNEITSKRSIKNSDKVIINLDSEDESVPDFIKSQKNLSIITDSEYQIIPNISKKLIEKKVKVGDKLIIKFDISKIIKQEKLKEVDFNIEILKIQELSTFEVTKDFLEKNNLKNEDELKESIKKSIKNQFENGIKQIEKKQIMDILESDHKFDLPQGILDEEFHGIMHRLEHAKKDNTLDEDDKNLSDKDLKLRYKSISERRVKLAILFQHIAKIDNILVSEKELKEGMINYASQYPGQEKQIFEYFKKNPSSVETIRGPILEEKVINNIVSKSKLETIKISVEEYKKLEQETFNLKKDKKNG